ncbi:hypothetical protein [Urechidicola croceus]|uniref:GLPGLI family protein n=1 Tax=Urechidicola croceus TaxID=1850246 RepID=A0A1D8P6N5_9FLAO|nr:hypothetical protein [Urechidicola croceus]AOW20229.1 hypothetical protein LPB138_05855 [Urechidicola croceus]
MKKIVIILFLLISISSFAQKQKATLYFKDGTTKTGLAKFTTFEEKIKFRKNRNSKKVVYDSNKIDKIIIRENDKNIEYRYKFVEGRERAILLEPLVEGEITLYRDLKEGYSPGVSVGGYGGGGMGMGMTMGGGYYSISNYFVARGNEKKLQNMGSTALFGKNFKKAAKEYFKDCPSLVKKINDKEFKKRDIVDVVEYYNNNCASKNDESNNNN